MTTRPTAPRQFRLAWLWKDSRSAFVGAVVAFLGSLIAAAFSQPPEVFIASMNDAGYSQPLGPLSRLIANETAERTYAFKPEDLTKTIFCEYIRLEADSQTANLEQLLTRYPRCFRVREVAEGSFEISAKSSSPEMVQKGSTWQCGCG